MNGHWMRWTGLTLAALCAAFWLWFGIASAFSEQEGVGNALAHVVVPGGILLATALLALRWSALGGTLLILQGLAVAVAYPWMVAGRFPLSTIVFVLLLLAAPPLIAGLLLLGDRRRFARRA